ncbi:MAG: hypothetical protein K5784_03070 [Clostridiales bacterium]|nr:hypothetical protein [Clostridiales bacterium]
MEEELLLSEKETAASMLLNGFLEKTTASRLTGVRFEPIVPDAQCVLSLSDFTCDVQEVPGDKIATIENDRYKAGVKLEWGGGLCYFRDKQNTAYDNLLNCHDTGRLVQQSFYGPMEIEGYNNGVFMGSKWRYNPVQGGDQYGNTSKLVALEQTKDTIRVVCRPLDWAQNDMPTQCYYTSVYRLTENGLEVENTAIDFQLTPWTPCSQELPAFYTLSALSTFTFYDGGEPWTDGELREEKDLEFWAGKPAFVLKKGNTENWSSWTDENGYGIGLYSPVAESLLAGRYMYNGTNKAEDDPTNYVAPLAETLLAFDEPFTYTYYLTAGTVNEIRAVFKKLR